LPWCQARLNNIFVPFSLSWQVFNAQLTSHIWLSTVYHRTVAQLYFLKYFRLHIFCCFIMAALSLDSQNASLHGMVKGTDGEGLDRVNIVITEDQSQQYYSDESGQYDIEIKQGILQTIVFFSISHSPVTY